MSRVVLVDHGLSNLGSIARAVEECGARPELGSRPEQLRGATHVILPGVGAFAEAMARLRGRGLDEALAEEVLDNHAAFLGICLGMHLIAGNGYEGGGCDDRATLGLGWIDGEVRRLEPRAGERLPHMGWNEVDFQEGNPLFAGLPAGKDFYFVHSYHFRPAVADAVAATTPYCGGFVSAVAQKRIFGVQFHPEKSQRPGFALLRNFLAL